MTSDSTTVRMEMPASTAFVRLARLSAAGLAADLGFSVEEVDDLRVAVDELFFYLVDDAAGGAIHIDFALLEDGITVEGRRPSSMKRTAESAEIDDLVREILAVTVDQWEVRADSEATSFRLEKRRRPLP